jgi:hypothetical protein
MKLYGVCRCRLGLFSARLFEISHCSFFVVIDKFVLVKFS